MPPPPPLPAPLHLPSCVCDRNDCVPAWKQASIRNEEVKEATRHLIQHAVPTLAALLSKHPRSSPAPSIGDEMHRRGINVRHMGLLRSLVDATTAVGAAARTATLVEIVARTLKQLLRGQLRASVLPPNSNGRSSNTAGTPYRRLPPASPTVPGAAPLPRSAGFHARPVEAAVQFLNLVSGAAAGSKEFWSAKLPAEVHSRFGSVAATVEEVLGLTTCVSSLSTCVGLLCTMSGIVLTTSTQQQFSRSPVGYRFVHADVSRLAAIARTSSKHKYAFGTSLVLEAVSCIVLVQGLPCSIVAFHTALLRPAPSQMKCKDQEAARRMFDRAARNFRQALSASPNHPAILSKLGHTLRQKAIALVTALRYRVFPSFTCLT